MRVSAGRRTRDYPSGPMPAAGAKACDRPGERSLAGLLSCLSASGRLRSHMTGAVTIGSSVTGRDETGDEAVSEPHFRQRLWGYDRVQVDAFVERTASRFSALQTASVPDSAVKEKIDRVTDETNGVLQRAYEIAREVTARAERDAEVLTRSSQEEAQQLTARAQQEADALTARSQQEAAQRREAAESEAASIVRDAEARANALDAEITALEQERDNLLDEIEGISQRLHAVVSHAADERAVPPRPAPADTVGTARAVAATPAGLAGSVAARPTETDRAEERRTSEMPAAVRMRDDAYPRS